MKLIVDIGNTRIKAAVFDGKEMVKHFVYDYVDEFLAADDFEDYEIRACIVGSVVEEMEDILESDFNTMVFTADTPVPIYNLYKSAHTLGSDRLAAAVGANALYPNKNILVIDAGTCIKYNFITDKNEYIGGGISPGMRMRFKALNDYTSRLPMLLLNENFDTLIGTDSNESILSGVQMGAVAEVDGIIDQYKKLYTNLTVVLTGGDFNFFEKRLKNPTFADQFLILKGLNAILDFNTESYGEN